MHRLIYILLWATSFVASACQSNSSQEMTTIRLNISQEPTSLDPRKARSLNDLNLTHMLFEGLTRMSLSGKVELALAERFELSEDGKRYLFHLRPSVWSNGNEVTAEDFIRSWRSLLDPQFPSSQAYQLYVIAGAKALRTQEALEWGARAIDALTLSIELEEPLPYFLELLSMPCFYPTSSEPPKEGECISNGPFILTEWAHGDHLQLCKNPYYWEAATVRLTGIELLMVSPETELALFAHHELDWAGSPLSKIPLDAIKTLRDTSEFHTMPAFSTYFFRINTASQEQPLLANPSLRKWLSDGIDRQTLVNQVLQGGEQPAYSLIPPALRSDIINPSPVKAQLEEAWDPASFPKRLVITYPKSESGDLIAQTLQEQWKQERGLHVLLDAVEPRMFFQRLSTGTYELALGSWFADVQDSSNFLEVFKYKSGSTNNTGWEDRQYIDLLTRSLVCVNRREELLQMAEQILIDEMPIIPLYHSSLSYLQKDTLHGVALSPLGQIDFRWAYFE